MEHAPGRRKLQQQDYDSFVEAASKREPPKKRDRQTLRNHLQAKNPWRWRALQRHLRWAEKEMLKLGINPEDVRWLL